MTLELTIGQKKLSFEVDGFPHYKIGQVVNYDHAEYRIEEVSWGINLPHPMERTNRVSQVMFVKLDRL